MQPVDLAAERFTGFFFLGLGAFICALNFYFSYLRYALYRLRGCTEQYRHSSGFPFLGSVMVVFILIRPHAFHFPLWAVLTGLVLATIDTGGPPWFIASQIYYYAIQKGPHLSPAPMTYPEAAEGEGGKAYGRMLGP